MSKLFKMISVGVIGYGYSAKTFHIPLLEASEFFRFTAISSSQKETVTTKYPDIEVFLKAKDLITSGKIQLAIITAPNDVHYSLARLCLENGINVVLEKPMVTTSKEAEELVSLSKERSLLLSVFHNRRWDGDFLTVKKLIENKKIGQIRHFESHFDRFRPIVRNRWREQPGDGAGVWFDLGSHLVDQALCIFGLPEALTARCLSLRENSETTDYFHVLLHYENLDVILHASPFTASPNNRFRLEGTKGSFVKLGFDPQEEQLKSGVAPNTPEYGVENQDSYGRLYYETSSDAVVTLDGCYNQFYVELANAINNDEKNPVEPEDAVKVMKILELAEKSSQLSKKILVSI